MRFAESAVFRISPKTFDSIDEWITAAEASGRNVQYGLNALAMVMARTNQALAMEMSRGPYDTHAEHPELAWKIPVRRITQHYYSGWKVRRLMPGVWMLYNDSREAWFIEFGISPHGTAIESRNGKKYIRNNRRVRRPVRKLSLMKTMRFVDQSRVNERVWASIFAPFRERHPSSRGNAFTSVGIQSYHDMSSL